MNSQTKGHGYFRKSKAYGLVCGIALAGAFVFSGGNVSAEEVTAPAQSQTVVTTLTAPTNNQAQAVTSTALDTAVSTAKEAGVTVNTAGAVSHTDVPSAQADLASQTQAVKDATAKAQANTQAIKDATAQNAQIDAQNQAEATRVAQENKAGQLAVDQQNAEAQAKADATNAQLKADYEAKLAEIKTIEDYNQAVAERNALAKAQADATNAQLKADYQVKLDAYNKALADRANLVANDVSFEGYGKSETLNGYGQVT
ncbi:putative cross-wall-targeting lipoprotein signal domain-containing protein, partial [Streptococcus uberis]|nr:putative cross-wall-targeting lipoprotein signal domain-containing protein [Streptococcus uberis]